MNDPRVALSAVVVVVLAIVAAVGVTWAAEQPTPSLTRDEQGLLFDDVHLTQGTAVTRCTRLRPEGGALTAIDFDGGASGSLTSAVTIDVVRGVAPAGTGDPCTGFVPERMVYSGPLDDLPGEDAPLPDPIVVPDGTAITYQATIALRPGPAAGRTRMRLRLTGIFAEPPAPGSPPARARHRPSRPRRPRRSRTAASADPAGPSGRPRPATSGRWTSGPPPTCRSRWSARSRSTCARPTTAGRRSTSGTRWSPRGAPAPTAGWPRSRCGCSPAIRRS